MNFKSSFRSRRVEEASPENRQPTSFEKFGGWGPAVEPGRSVDPVADERAQRVAGAVALAELEKDRQADAAARMAQRLGNAPRGVKYG